MKYVIQGGIIVTPEFIMKEAAITVDNGRISELGKADSSPDFVINLRDNDIVFPGLINAHDHLLGNYYPRVGTGPYMNWRPWDNDLKTAPVYEERGKISNFDLYVIAAYRNIISGVTTVQDHIPHFVNEEFIDKLPLRVIKRYSLEHECSSYDLKWGRGITVEHNDAVKNDMPFITHIEEGYDEEATLGIDILKELNALDEFTVLIHGISLSKEDISDIAKHKANLVWCPSSNYYMFKDTTDIKELLVQGVNVSLGTDSPMSGGLNILDELQFAHTLYKELYNEEIDYKTLVNMVTVNAAKAMRLKDLGRIQVGNIADFLILCNGDVSNPYKSLVNAGFDNISMVISEGKPVYGYGKDYDFFEHFTEFYQLTEVNGKERILIGKPIDLYERIWEGVKFKKILPFFPVDFYQ
jgi:cytosine/adenosine deaminase-related metal-dependent hydrolase